MNNIVIRKAQINDLEILQELSEELTISDAHYDPKLMKNWAYTSYGKKYLQSRIYGKKCICLIAESNGTIAGYATGTMLKTLTWRKVKRVQLENLLVKDRFRNQGIGAKLVTAFVSWGKAMKAERIVVEAYFDNTKAVNFYKNNGFKENDLILEKIIS